MPSSPRSDPAEHVFGYGSLLERWDRPGPAGGRGRPAPAVAVAELAGYRRTWNVAMDNTRTIPGYKYYVDPATGERGSWFVTFLNIVPDPAARVNGVIFAVTPALLARLDARERNYERIDVGARVSPPRPGRVWAYAGTAAAVGRYELGSRSGRAVISRRYRDGVLEDFGAVGAAARSRFLQLTDPAPCPLLDLQRIEVPASDELSAGRHGGGPGPADPRASA
jgi:hypothetical protein